MKEKMLKEKGGAKVYIIIIAVLVILCAAVGVFAVINMNKDKDEEEKTSKKNETNTSKTVDDDEDKDDKKGSDNKTSDDEEDDDNDGVIKYSGVIDMPKIMGTDELKDTVWTLTVEGNDDTLSKMVITAELEKYFKQTFEDAVGDSDAYSYEEFVDLIHTQLDSTMGSIGTEMASDLGISASKVTSNVSWVDDETLEIEIDLSKTKKSDYKGIDDDESVIEFVVESLKDQDIEMKKSK